MHLIKPYLDLQLLWDADTTLLEDLFPERATCVSSHATIMINITKFTMSPMCARVNMSPMVCSLVRRNIGLFSQIWHGHDMVGSC